MAKIKLTKNEAKKQRDLLAMYRRYLPTLILKQQQLQAEIRITDARIIELKAEKDRVDEIFKSWIAVFGEKDVFTPDILKIIRINTAQGNIAGVSIPLFRGAEFEITPYDLGRLPLWIDIAIERLQQVLLIDLEAQIVEEQRRRLYQELRITTQRVNLFEKVKIPETKSNIKKIQVYLGDQQVAAIVRGKIAKRGLEKATQRGKNP